MTKNSFVAEVTFKTLFLTEEITIVKDTFFNYKIRT